MNALDICNGCDVNVADPTSAAGYCAECAYEAQQAYEMDLTIAAEDAALRAAGVEL